MDYSKYTQIEFRRKFWKIVGASITMTDPADETVIGFIKMKAWKFREDISVFSDTSQQQEVMRIKARQIIDFGATYDITDSVAGQPIISLQRKGLRSTFVRDHWRILGPEGDDIGYIQETSSALAIVRRYIGIIPYAGEILAMALAFVPESYRIVHVVDGVEQTAGTVLHRKNPFIVKMHLDFTNSETSLDKRIGVSATALLAIVDANKN